MKWHLMSWRFLCCCTLIACGYIHQQWMLWCMKAVMKNIENILTIDSFNLNPYRFSHFFFMHILIFKILYWISFQLEPFFFFFCIDKELCICSCCHHLISGFKRLSWFLDFFFLNAFCSFCCKPFCYSRGSVTELCKRRTYLCPKRMQFYCSLSFVFSVRNW